MMKVDSDPEVDFLDIIYEFSENLDIISMSPLYFCSIFSSRRTPLGDFLEPSTTKSSSSSRARVAGTPGARLPGVLPHQFGACIGSSG